MLDTTSANYWNNISELEEKIAPLNDYETLWSDLNRLCSDIAFARSPENALERIKKFN